jgi:hypothetical protein
MKPALKHFFRLGLVWIVTIGICACTLTITPFEYHDDREEKQGPGLFSGEEGGFVIITEPETKTAGAEHEADTNP